MYVFSTDRIVLRVLLLYLSVNIVVIPVQGAPLPHHRVAQCSTTPRTYSRAKSASVRRTCGTLKTFDLFHLKPPFFLSLPCKHTHLGKHTAIGTRALEGPSALCGTVRQNLPSPTPQKTLSFAGRPSFKCERKLHA